MRGGAEGLAFPRDPCHGIRDIRGGGIGLLLICFVQLIPTNHNSPSLFYREREGERYSGF